jgi:hypothetical protein
MNPSEINAQINDVLGRLIESSLSVEQKFPSLEKGEGGSFSIGLKNNTSISMRNIKYSEVYKALVDGSSYHAKLIDGALLCFQYRFAIDQSLEKHSLHYWPSPCLPSLDEEPELYADHGVYDDVISDRNVRFPIRFDYAPKQKQEIVHPSSHLTLGQYENCRIPVAGPVTPVTFVLFIVRNFYFTAYVKNKNLFDKKPSSLARIDTISTAERRITHLVNGR